MVGGLSEDKTNKKINIDNHSFLYSKYNYVVFDLKRPISRKGEKQWIKKRKNRDCMTSPLVGILIKIKEDNKKNGEKKTEILDKAYLQEEPRLLHEKERLAMKNEMFKAEQLEEEERIMLMDTSGLTPMQKQYYCRQIEIFEKGN
ncbi:hypothetical protein ACSBR1_023650 [Camellia fascicularis]